MKIARTRLLEFGLLAVMIMLASAPAVAQGLPSWFGDANVRRHFVASGPGMTEDATPPYGSGFAAAVDVYPSTIEPWERETLLNVENEPDQLSVKHVWLQYTWQETGPGAIADPMNQNLHGSTGAWSPPTWATEDLGGGTFRRTIEWNIFPQPEHEWFKWLTYGGFSVTDIKVATYCEVVPEPSSLLVLGSGFAGMLCLIKRRRSWGKS